jgi:hypothetical protein
MNTEHWALVVSAIALLVAIGIPVWQWRATNAQTIASKRTLLLQRILSTRSANYVAMHELLWMLNRYGNQMESDQRVNLQNMVPRMRQHHDDLEKLHTEWSNYNDGKSLNDLEQTLADVDMASAEAEDNAKLIENGRRSYEGV